MNPKKKLEIVLRGLAEYGDISLPGENEIFKIYKKFIRFCLPETKNISFYSQHVMPYSGESRKDFIELDEDEQRTLYLLDPKTRLFHEYKVLENNRYK